MTSRKMSTVVVGAAIISIGTLISRILGLVRERLLLNTFGDSNTLGAYNSAFMVPDLLYYLLAGGALSAAFIPVFSGYLAKGERDDANRTGSTIGNLMLLAIAVGVLIELIFAPALVWLIAPGYRGNPELFNLTVSLTRVMCVMVLFTAISGLLTGMLNSFHHFLAPTIVWNVYNLAIIAGVVMSKQPLLGGSPDAPNIYAVCYGVVSGALLMALIQIPFVLRHGFRYSPILDLAHSGVRQVLKLFAPVMVGLSLSQFNLLAIPLIIGSVLGAPAVTDIRAANRLVLLPLGLFAVAISTAAFPKLAQQIATGETQAFRDMLTKAIKAILLLSLPSAVGLFILAEPLNYALWGGGEFGKGGIQAAAFTLMFFSWGLLGISIVQVVNRAYYSLHDTTTPVIAGICMVAVNIPLAYVMAKYTPFKYGGVALSTSITSTISTLVLLEILRRRLGGIGGRSIFVMAMKALAASAVMGVVIYLVATKTAPVLNGEVIVPAFHWPAPYVPFSKEIGEHAKLEMSFFTSLMFLLRICVSIVAGIAVYFGALWVLRVEEMHSVAARILGRFRKSSSAV